MICDEILFEQRDVSFYLVNIMKLYINFTSLEVNKIALYSPILRVKD